MGREQQLRRALGYGPVRSPRLRVRFPHVQGHSDGRGSLQFGSGGNRLLATNRAGERIAWAREDEAERSLGRAHPMAAVLASRLSHELFYISLQTALSSMSDHYGYIC